MNLHAFKHGARAYQNGLPHLAVPYDADEEIKRCWLAGWNWQNSGGKRKDIPGVRITRKEDDSE